MQKSNYCHIASNLMVPRCHNEVFLKNRVRWRESAMKKLFLTVLKGTCTLSHVQFLITPWKVQLFVSCFVKFQIVHMKHVADHSSAFTTQNLYSKDGSTFTYFKENNISVSNVTYIVQMNPVLELSISSRTTLCSLKVSPSSQMYNMARIFQQPSNHTDLCSNISTIVNPGRTAFNEGNLIKNIKIF
jgi:hypothetical protein